MILVSIDPGSAGKGNAWALYREGVLHLTGFAREASEVAPVLIGPRGEIACTGFPRGSRVVVERPEYQGTRTRAARPQDLMALAWSGALLAGGLAALGGVPPIEVAPTSWKGTAPKPQTHRHAWLALSSEEREVVGGAAVERTILAACEAGALERWAKPGGEYYPRGFSTHNILDAVALGLVALGRLSLTRGGS